MQNEIKLLSQYIVLILKLQREITHVEVVHRPLSAGLNRVELLPPSDSYRQRESMLKFFSSKNFKFCFIALMMKNPDALK